jgi:glycosyltransferase involved in cell wall biosynthesis
MKILCISNEIPYFPGGFGGQTRQYHLLKELSSRHEIDFIGPRVEGDVLNTLRKVCRTVVMPDKQSISRLSVVRSSWKKAIPLAIKKPIRSQIEYLAYLRSEYPLFVQQQEALRVILSPLVDNALRQERYDLIQIDHTNIAHWVQAFQIEIPKVLIAHNVKTIMWKRYCQYARGLKKRFFRRDHLRFEKYETEHFRRYNGVVAMSGVDKNYINVMCGADVPVFVVPNGVDTDYFLHTDNSSVDPDNIVFTGSMFHPPNNDAALYFCDKIFPAVLSQRPSATFSIVGSSPSTDVMRLSEHSKIRVTGFVPDVRPYLFSASVVVVPLLSGSGTRLKILEAMSMGKAIVSTSIGAEGLEYTNNENILIADDEISFAKKIIYLMSNPQKRMELGLNARRLAEERYEWKLQAEMMESVYSFVVKDERCAASQDLRR